MEALMEGRSPTQTPVAGPVPVLTVTVMTVPVMTVPVMTVPVMTVPVMTVPVRSLGPCRRPSCARPRPGSEPMAGVRRRAPGDTVRTSDRC